MTARDVESDGDFNPFDAPPPAEPGAKRAEPEGGDELPELPPNARVVHVTELERFLECGHRHSMYSSRLWTEAGDFRPRTRGSAVHAARERAFKHFLRKGELPPLDDLEQFAAAKVEELLLGRGHEALDTAEPDVAEQLRAEADAVIDEAIPFVRGDYKLLLPTVAPHVIEVEPKFRVALATKAIAGEDAAPWFLTGTPDSIGRDPTTGKLVLPDLKTGAKAAKQAELNTSSQLTGYAFLAHQRYGEVPVLAHHSLRILKRLPRKTGDGISFATVKGADGEEVVAVAERRSTERSVEDLRSFVRRLNVFVSSQVAGIALPATASNFLSPCHRCAHRGHPDESQRCPFVPAFRGAEGEEADDEQ